MQNSLSPRIFPARQVSQPPSTLAHTGTARAPSSGEPERRPTKPANETMPTASRTPDRDTVDAQLAQLHTARTAQLHSIDADVRDAVTRAYRDSVLRALENIRTARERLSAGLYGLCACCGEAIAPERLELMPSTSMCVRCAVHNRGG